MKKEIICLLVLVAVVSSIIVCILATELDGLAVKKEYYKKEFEACNKQQKATEASYDDVMLMLIHIEQVGHETTRLLTDLTNIELDRQRTRSQENGIEYVGPDDIIIEVDGGE